MANLRLVKEAKIQNEELGERLKELASSFDLFVDQQNVVLDMLYMVEARFDNVSITLYDFSHDAPYCPTRRLWEIDRDTFICNGRLNSSKVIADRISYCIVDRKSDE